MADYEYVAHDYGPVNEYVQHLADQHKAVIERAKANNFATYAKWGSIGLLAIGLTILLVLWGVSLLITPEIITTEKTVREPTDFKPTIIVNNPGAGGDSALDATRNAARQQVDQLSHQTSSSGAGSPNSDATATVYNYTIFKEVPYKRDGIGTITIGMKYNDSNAKKPAEQWCYIDKPTADGMRLDITLAVQDGGVRTDRPITPVQASRFGSSLDTIKDAQRRCSFEQ